MSIQGFVLGVTLLALVGWCMVQESLKQTHARYHLAELARQENEMRKKLDRLRAKEQELRSPARLAALIRTKRLDLVSLVSKIPEHGDQAARRRPGQVLDWEPTEGAGDDVDVASVGQR